MLIIQAYKRRNASKFDCERPLIAENGSTIMLIRMCFSKYTFLDYISWCKVQGSEGIRSRTDMALAMKQISPCLISGTAVDSEIYSLHLSQKSSYLAVRPSFSSLISITMSKSSEVVRWDSWWSPSYKRLLVAGGPLAF